MKLKLQVDYNGDQYEVNTTLKTIVAWERKFKSKVSKLAEGIGLEDLAYLAYEASKAAGLTMPAVFDDFINKCDNIEVVDTDNRPTQEAQSDGN